MSGFPVPVCVDAELPGVRDLPAVQNPLRWPGCSDDRVYTVQLYSRGGAAVAEPLRGRDLTPGVHQNKVPYSTTVISCTPPRVPP